MEEGKQNVVETIESKKNVDVNRKKQARGRGQSLSNRGRGSRVNDQMKSQISLSTIPPTNGQHDSLYLKVISSQISNIFCAYSNNFV